MARKRYQHGTLKLKQQKNKKVWVLRYREDLFKDGRRIRVCRQEHIPVKDFPTRKLALRELEKRLSEINSLDYQPTVEGTFRQFSERWIRDVLSQKKYSTQTTERSRINNHLVPWFGELKVRQIGAGAVQQFVANAGLIPKTTRNCAATLRMMWNSAKAWGYTSVDWFDGVHLPEYVRPEVPHFSLAEMKQIIGAAEGAFQAFCWLAAETGMRLGELCALKVKCLHFAAGVIEVRYSSWHGRVGSTKSKRPRIFRLSPQLLLRLREQVAPVMANPEAFVFRSRKGTAWIGDEIVKDNLRPLLLRLGIKVENGAVMPGVGLHAFRHGNATVMDSERIPLKVRQDRLGHVDGEEITLGIYTHAESDDHQAVAEKLGALLAPVESNELAQMEPVNKRAM